MGRYDIQPRLEPLVVSWGYESQKPCGSGFIDHHEWQGTRDIAAFLSVPAAIRFQAMHNWEAVRRNCHRMASQTRQRINDLTGMEPISPDSSAWFAQMAAVRLPQWVEPETLQRRLYVDYHIEAPVHLWSEHPFLRASFQAYNDFSDADALVEALADLLAR